MLKKIYLAFPKLFNRNFLFINTSNSFANKLEIELKQAKQFLFNGDKFAGYRIEFRTSFQVADNNLNNERRQDGCGSGVLALRLVKFRI